MSRFATSAPRTLGLLLVDGFALLSYAAVVEPFRAANNLAGAELYSWTHVCVGGEAARASNGAAILADAKVGEALDCDLLFVFAGGDPTTFDDPATFAWLRQMAGRGVGLAGVSGGPYLLARAGLLEGRRATIHWEHAAAFREDFPGLALEDGLYVIDGRRMTCAGGTAGLDLAIELIERDQGHALAGRVGEWFIRTESRRAERSQRLSLRDRYGVRHDGTLRALAAMEAAVEDPHSRDELAARAGVSVRQLERLFRTHLKSTVAGIYLRIRLEQASQLLRTTGLSVTDVAIACGFSNGSHFARVFRRAFGHAPGAGRESPRDRSTGSP
ncbi:GlxA family transcriptional regulator [Phenylobacterium sp. LjRoot225]|uniref:GlxA family transcriptional regulator n=1 Tax=Phenylobacterium sp. LjRoot225 TaxID=3342285 RepID=UPI003ECC2A11